MVIVQSQMSPWRNMGLNTCTSWMNIDFEKKIIRAYTKIMVGSALKPL